MNFVKTLNGYEIYQNKSSNKFQVAIDTPDGMVRSGLEFETVELAEQYIQKELKQ
jgi:hypothetical protein